MASAGDGFGGWVRAALALDPAVLAAAIALGVVFGVVLTRWVLRRQHHDDRPPQDR